MNKEQWEKSAKEVTISYVDRKDGCFDDVMHANFASCDYDERWQRAAPLSTRTSAPGGK